MCTPPSTSVPRRAFPASSTSSARRHSAARSEAGPASAESRQLTPDVRDLAPHLPSAPPTAPRTWHPLSRHTDRPPLLSHTTTTHDKGHPWYHYETTVRQQLPSQRAAPAGKAPMLDIAYAAGCCSLTATSRESVSIMSENTAEATAEATELTSHYSAQVAGDLERNLKEQQRLSDEIDALQTQLAALRHDHSVLVNIQQALGVGSEPATPSAPATEPELAPAGRKQAKSATR